MNCPGALDIPLVYGYMAATSTPVQGTIVLLPGSGGTNANGDNVADFITGVSYDRRNYPSKGYNVVQIAWGNLSPGGRSQNRDSFARLVYTLLCFENPLRGQPGWNSASRRRRSEESFVDSHRRRLSRRVSRTSFPSSVD